MKAAAKLCNAIRRGGSFLRDYFKWIQLILILVTICGSVVAGSWNISRTFYNETKVIIERVVKLETEQSRDQLLIAGLVLFMKEGDRYTEDRGAAAEKAIEALKERQTRLPDWFQHNFDIFSKDVKDAFKTYHASLNLFRIKLQTMSTHMKDGQEEITRFIRDHVKDLHSEQFKREGSQYKDGYHRAGTHPPSKS